MGTAEIYNIQIEIFCFDETCSEYAADVKNDMLGRKYDTDGIMHMT